MPHIRFVRSCVAACALGAALSFAAPAAAQSGRGDPDWLNPDVVQLRDDVEILRREVERLSTGRAVNGDLPIAASPSSDLYVRIDQLETDARRLTGELERIVFETSRAIQIRDQQIAELSARLAVLEGMLDVTPAASQTAPVGSAPGIAPPAAAASSASSAANTVAGAGAAAGAAVAPTIMDDGSDARAPGALGEIEVGAGAAPISDSPIYETPGAADNATAAAPTGPAPTYEEAIDFLRARDYQSAETALTAFIAANPNDPRIGEATYWLGETYYLGGQFDKAARAFLTSFRDHPTGEKAPNSLLRLGVTLANLGRREEACASFEQVPVRYPDAPERLQRQAQVEARRAGCP